MAANDKRVFPGRIQCIRSPVWHCSVMEPIYKRGLGGRLGRRWSCRGLWAGNHPLQRLDHAGHLAHSPPAISTETQETFPTDGAASLCHRFLTHMNTSPGDLRPPCFLSSQPSPKHHHLGRTPSRQTIAAPRIRYPGPRTGRQLWDYRKLQWDPGNACVPPSPPPSRASPAPPTSLSPFSRAQQPAVVPRPTEAPVQPCSPPLTPSLASLATAPHEGNDNLRDRIHSASSPSASSSERGLRSSFVSGEPSSLAMPLTPELDDISDFSRPPSSRFSRNSDYRRNSVLSGISGVGSSSLCLSALASSCSSVGLLPDRSSDPLQTLSRSSLMFAPGYHSDRDRFCPSRPEQDNLASDLRARIARPGVTPPSTLPGQMSGRRPVLPPISSLRGARETRESTSSRACSSESDVFEELDAHAQGTGSCLSLEQSSSSNADCSSPDTVLSHQAHSLVLGCNSGGLGSLSRVRLLLFEYPEDVEPCSPVPECGLLSADSTRYQNEDERGPCGMFREDQFTESLAPHAPAGGGEGAGLRRCGTSGAEGQRVHTKTASEENAWHLSSSFQESFLSDSALTAGSGRGSCQSLGSSRALEVTEAEERHPSLGCEATQWRAKHKKGSWKLEHLLEEKRRMEKERKAKVLHIYSQLNAHETTESPTSGSNCHSRFEDFDFLAKYCIFSQEKLSVYKQAFEAVDTDGDGYLTCFQVLLALKDIVPPRVLSDSEEIYIYRILEIVDFRVTQGLTDLRLFAVVASLAEKIASLDDFTRSLIGKLDFQTVEMKLYRAKQLFLFLLETQAGVSPGMEGVLSAEQLLMELRAGGIWPENEEVVTNQLRHLKSLDLLDFLAHLPLFLLIHGSVVTNPLDDTRSL